MLIQGLGKFYCSTEFRVVVGSWKGVVSINADKGKKVRNEPIDCEKYEEIKRSEQKWYGQSSSGSSEESRDFEIFCLRQSVPSWKK